MIHHDMTIRIQPFVYYPVSPFIINMVCLRLAKHAPNSLYSLLRLCFKPPLNSGVTIYISNIRSLEYGEKCMRPSALISKIPMCDPFVLSLSPWLKEKGSGRHQRGQSHKTEKALVSELLHRSLFAIHPN